MSRDQIREDSDLILFRTLNGLMQGGIALTSALHYLSPEKRRVRGFFRERERRARLKCPLLTDPGWEALEFVYRRGLSGTDLMTRLIPILDDRIRLNRRIGALRRRAMCQWGFAAAVPWGLSGTLLWFTPELRAVTIALGELAVIGLAVIYQCIGGWVAWRVAGFFYKSQRRETANLLSLLDRVLVGLECGLELGYVWQKAGGPEATELEPFSNTLGRFAEQHPVAFARPWFAGLSQLYREGAPLVPYFQAFAESLRDRLRREMENHDRELPFRLNIVLLIFSLPPVFVLLFGAIFLGLANV